jgi:hypothetical protein
MSQDSTKELYQQDSYAWYLKNAKLLREKRFEEIDLDNLIEEVESMGNKEKHILESYLTLLFMHLLKWQYQPERQGSSWEKSIRSHRRNAIKHIRKNPSLKGCLDEIVKEAYENARYEAEKETDLHLTLFPEHMPFTLDEALQEDWLPE